MALVSDTLDYKIKSNQQYYDYEKNPEVQATKQIEAKSWGACGIVTAVCLASFGIGYLGYQKGELSWPAALSIFALAYMGKSIASMLLKTNKNS